MKDRRLYLVAVTITATLGILFYEGSARAAASFLGQGTVAFDSISVGRQGIGGVTYFNGTIINQTTGAGGADNPVTYGDSLRVDGSIWRGATRGPGDPNPTIVDDDLTVEGDIRWDDGSSLASIVDSQLSVDTALLAAESVHRAAIRNLEYFTSCVGDFAEDTVFVESTDYIFCWNLWLAGTTFLSAGSSVGGAPDEDLTVEQQARAQTFIGSQESSGIEQMGHKEVSPRVSE